MTNGLRLGFFVRADFRVAWATTTKPKKKQKLLDETYRRRGRSSRTCSRIVKQASVARCKKSPELNRRAPG